MVGCKKRNLAGNRDITVDLLNYRRNGGVDLHQIPFDHNVSDQPRGIFKTFRRKVNLFLGRLMGLNSINNRLEWERAIALYNFCCELRIPLFIMGPLPMPLRMMKDEIAWSYLNKRYIKKLKSDATACLLLDELYRSSGRSLFKADLLHLNEYGHSRLGEYLYPAMQRWLYQNFNKIERRRAGVGQSVCTNEFLNMDPIIQTNP